ncbi:MAG: hypothetical protein ABMB14_32435, partial [Myxococcota bacterium]
LSAAVPPETWSGLDAAARSTALTLWLDRVLLAYDQPVGAAGAAVVAKTGSVSIDRHLLRREDAAGQWAELTERHTFDKALGWTVAAPKVAHRYVTTLFFRADRVTGVPEAAVDQALTSKGQRIRDCFTDAWAQDLALATTVHLGWTIAGGKVGVVRQIAAPGQAADAGADALAKCYGSGIREGAYPAEVTGDVAWVFAVDKRELPPQ